MNKEMWPEELLFWFSGNRRDFPWRTMPRDPYAVWISEIMLQQTRTEAVRPYFESWMQRFPTVSSLAAAEEADILHAWQGLGYYSRARNIKKAADILAREYGGAMPRDFEKIRALPGIGDYTAGAISSIAFGMPVPAVDGNVLRIIARLYAIEDDILKPETRRLVTETVRRVLPKERPGDFNEALMDFGADICIPGNPRCRDCPLRKNCLAFSKHRTEILPHRTRKKPQTEFFAACAVIKKDGKYLLHLRGAGMLAHMWEFPAVLDSDEETGKKRLASFLHTTLSEKIWEHTHVFTHRIWHMRAYRVSDVSVPEDGTWKWVSAADMRKIPMAGPHGKLAGILLESFF